MNAIKLIQARAAAAYGVPVEAMHGRLRRDNWCEARHAAIHLVVSLYPDASYELIARQFGLADHTAVSYAVRASRKMQQTDAAAHDRFAALRCALATEIDAGDAARAGLRREITPPNGRDATHAATSLADHLGRWLKGEALRDPEAFLKRYGPPL